MINNTGRREWCMHMYCNKNNYYYQAIVDSTWVAVDSRSPKQFELGMWSMLMLFYRSSVNSIKLEYAQTTKHLYIFGISQKWNIPAKISEKMISMTKITLQGSLCDKFYQSYAQTGMDHRINLPISCCKNCIIGVILFQPSMNKQNYTKCRWVR